MIELGESFYSTGEGGKPPPIEWRIFTSFIWNIVIFLGLKFLAKYIGGESMSELVRGAVDKVLDNPVTVENIEQGVAGKVMEDNNSNSNDGIGSLFDSFLGSGGDGSADIAQLIANMGTNFTQKMENQNNKKSVGKKKRVIFTE